MEAKQKLLGFFLLLFLISACAGSEANAYDGEAVLFDSVNEQMQPVSMADMIDGRPLVLAVGSAS